MTAVPTTGSLDGGQLAPEFGTDAVLAQARGENFPVASAVLPRRMRGHLLAIYGVARLIDDIGDEAPGDRLAQLDWVDADLQRAQTGDAVHPLVRALTPMIDELDLSVQPFHDLVEANRIDQQVTRYGTFEDLVGYCRLSAVPVGRLVLAVFGAATPVRTAASDQVCIGLQITEHLQDVAEDAARGRIYLPERDRAACGVGEDDLVGDRATPELRRLVALESARARRLLAAGSDLARSLPWPQRAAVAGFAGGGLAALDALQRARYDVLAGTHRAPRARVVARAATIALGRTSPGAASAAGGTVAA
jgi:squalene synthase HpnC